MDARDYAVQLGAHLSSGMNWDWAMGFTPENATKFIAFLDANGYEHRGQYPVKVSNTVDVRFR